MKLHKCSVCGKEGEWTEEWSWFGNYADLEEEKPVLLFCSEECVMRGPAAPAEETIDGEGVILACEYSISCGRCGEVSRLAAYSASEARNVANEDGWQKLKNSGWTCASCIRRAEARQHLVSLQVALNQ